MRDLHNKIAPVTGISPAAATTDNTAYISAILDRQGADSVEFIILTGNEADADATFTVLFEHGDAADLSDHVAVDDSQLLGLESQASFTFADDNKVFKIGYIGIKRYLRVTITPANNTGNVFIAGVWIKSNLALAPAPNPPA